MRAGGGAVFEAAANVEHADHQLLGHLLMIQLLTCAQVAEFSPAVDVQGVLSVFEAESNNIAAATVMVNVRAGDVLLPQNQKQCQESLKRIMASFPVRTVVRSSRGHH